MIRGKKTDKEKFAGALGPCVEADADGKSLQVPPATISANFGRAQRDFQSKEGRDFVADIVGASTRMIGALTGAQRRQRPGAAANSRRSHVAIVPIWKSDAEKASVLEASDRLARELRDDGLTVKLDDRDDKRPGEKYYEWERKGVPLRLEVGPRDVASGSAMAKSRIGDPKAKEKLPFDGIGVSVAKMLDQMQSELFRRALAFRESNTVTLDTWYDFEAVFAGAGSKYAYAHWDGTTERAGIRTRPRPPSAASRSTAKARP